MLDPFLYKNIDTNICLCYYIFIKNIRGEYYGTCTLRQAVYVSKRA